MKDGAGGGRGLQPTLSAHPQPCARPPAATAAAPWTREPVRPAQPSQILPTRPLVKEPRPELLIGPRIVTPAGWTPIVSHDNHGTSLKQICRTHVRSPPATRRRVTPAPRLVGSTPRSSWMGRSGSLPVQHSADR